jgi:hypothetical protein
MIATETAVQRHRRLSREYAAAQRARERAHRDRIKLRLRKADWPIDAATLRRADLDPGDVCMPLPPQPPGIDHYKQVAVTATGLEDTSSADEGLNIARHHAHVREIEDAAERRGAQWTPMIVGYRLSDAFSVLLRSRFSVRPRGFASSLPTPVIELADLVAQAENQALRKTMSRLLRRYGPVTSIEASRMAEAISWPCDYLGHDVPIVARCVNLGAWWAAIGKPVARGCETIGLSPSTFYRYRHDGIEAIVAGLAADGKAPL